MSTVLLGQPPHGKNRWEFAIGYVENFLRWYTAFRLREPQILSTKKLDLDDLSELIRLRLKKGCVLVSKGRY